MAKGSGYRRIGTVVVANRGEIAVRIIRASRELGIRTIAIYGDGDEDALHVQLADEAHRIPGSDGLPYLRQDAIVDLAIGASADAIHPGYGFLSENADFAERVASARLTYVGPSATAIRTMGDKVAARRIASEAGVEPVPGSSEPVSTVAEARDRSEEIGYPIAVKASGGGGGRGFRLARYPQELAVAFDGSRGEAERYFSNTNVYLERYLERPRHIEVQVFGDSHGALVAMGERDCSVQRRHQKLIEETPSLAVSPQLRDRLLGASERLARAVDYIGAGTIEYLLAEDGSFYFLEMNTRIQVEHTVTEMVSGIDLVKEQMRVAEGAPLSFGTEVRETRGWSIQCRINAEDPGRDFAPAPGTLTAYREPAGFGVRVDSAMSAGATVHAGYDSMIAKLVTWGVDREEAIDRMQRCLSDYVIEGVPTTIGLHQRVLSHPAFRESGATTTFITDFPDVVPPPVGTAKVADRPERTQERVLVEVNGQRFDVVVHGGDAPGNGRTTADRGHRPRRPDGRGSNGPGSNGNDLVSPIQGTAIRLEVAKGDRVEAGQLVCVVEAMKMENELLAHQSGTVGSLAIKVGSAVKVGDVVATIEPV